MTALPPSLLRRIVLVSAFGLALVVSGAWQPTPEARAAETGKSATSAASPANTPASKSEAPGKADASATSGGAPDTSSSADTKSDVEQHAVVVDKGGKRVRVVGLGEKDREYESFKEFVHNEPEFYGMVVAVVAVIFLSPVFLVAIVMAYRMRKARLLNETLLQLAEKGAVAPGEAMQALAGGQLPPTVTQPVVSSDGTKTTTAPSLLDQARQARKFAAWSDLRKGVIVGAVGLGFTVHDVARGRAPDTFGLILLFIGAAYAALWWYETRQLPSPGAGTPPGSGT